MDATVWNGNKKYDVPYQTKIVVLHLIELVWPTHAAQQPTLENINGVALNEILIARLLGASVLNRVSNNFTINYDKNS